MRPLPLLGLLLALVLPGCASLGSDVTTAFAPRLDGVALAFGPAKAMAQPTGGAEPNVAVAPDGTLWIAAVAGSQERPNALEGASWLWRSRDGGASWETLRAPERSTPLGTSDAPGTRRPFGSSDADVVVAADGWVYYSDWWNWGSPVLAPAAPVGLPLSPNARYGSYLVEASGDGGQTWTAAPVTTLDSVGGIDRQWLVTGEAGRVGLFYAYFHGVQNAVRSAGDLYGRGDGLMSIEAVWSSDHGATWSDPAPVVPPVSAADYQIAHPRYLGNGTFWMPYGKIDYSAGYDEWRGPSEVRISIGEDNGTRWRSRAVAQVPEGFDNLWAVQGASDATGRMVVAWAARTGETMTLFVSESTDLGETWTPPLALRAEGLNFLPWVDARGDGEVALAWYGGDAAGDPTKAEDNATWHAYVAHRPSATAAWGVGLLSPDPVKTGPLCPKGAACAGNRELLDYPSVAFGPDGRLHAAFATSRDVAGVKAGLVTYAGAIG